MCNFYVLRRPVDEIAAAFAVPERPNLEPRTVVRPTNVQHVAARGQDGGRHLAPMRWGLVPSWAKDLRTGLTMTNARAETITERPAYRTPFAKGRRALVPLDGFYEFTGPKGAKQPHLFRPCDGHLLAFAGLWEQWPGPRDAPLERPLLSYTFATTAANGTVTHIHDSMPVLLSEPAQWNAWLSPDTSEADLFALLRPAPDDLLETFPVTRELLRLREPGAEVLMPANSA